MAAELTDEQLDEIAARFWRESRYSGRDGQDFDHRAFARECERMTRQALGLDQTPDGVGVPDVGYTEADLMTALAECRNLFPIPPSGHPAEHAWTQAINCPLHVPVFIKAALAHGVKVG